MAQVPRGSSHSRFLFFFSVISLEELRILFDMAGSLFAASRDESSSRIQKITDASDSEIKQIVDEWKMDEPADKTFLARIDEVIEEDALGTSSSTSQPQDSEPETCPATDQELIALGLVPPPSILLQEFGLARGPGPVVEAIPQAKK